MLNASGLANCGAAALLALLTAISGAAWGATADITIPGLTFAVASESLHGSTGHHFHGDEVGGLVNAAEVGWLSAVTLAEEVRGLSEFDVTGLGFASSARVTFKVARLGGFFVGGFFGEDNQFPFIGTIQVVAYVGNNEEDVSDYQAPIAAVIGSFSTEGLNVGDEIIFDVTAALNAATTRGARSLGIRLVPPPSLWRGALSFDSFSLIAVSAIPVPGIPALGIALLSFAIAAIALVGFRQRRLFR